MGTPSNVEVGRQLQEKAKAQLQGTDAMFGGRGTAIAVSEEQSDVIMASLNNMAAEIQFKDPDKLTEAEKQILALVGTVGKGKISGKQACQALLITNSIANAMEGAKGKKAETARQLARKAREEIAMNVMPAEAKGFWSNRQMFRASKQLEGGMQAFLWGNWITPGKDANRIIERHPIIARYNQRLGEIKQADSTLTKEEIHNKAMAEAITAYGDNEVDKLMQQVEAEEKKAMAEEQRREMHRKKEDLQTELDAGKGKHEKMVAKKATLEQDNESKLEEWDELLLDIDEIDAELRTLPPHVDTSAIEQRLSQARVDQTASEAEVRLLKIELGLIEEAIKNEKDASYIIDLSPLRQEVDNYITDQAAYQAEAKKLKAEADVLVRKEQALRQAGDTDGANALLDRIAPLNAESAENQALADAHKQLIENTKNRINDLQANKGKLTSTQFEGFRQDKAYLAEKIKTQEVNQVQIAESVKKDTDELNRTNTQNEARKQKESTRQEKVKRQNRLRDEVRHNQDKIDAMQPEITAYEDKQKELTGVDKLIQATEKAATEAKKVLESGKTSIDEIATYFGIDRARINDNDYMAATKLATGNNSISTTAEAATALKKTKEFNFWQFLMQLFGGAQIA